MSRNQPEGTFNPARALQKFVVSAFVVFTFVVYALHEHFANADAGTPEAASTASSDIAQPSSNAPQDAPTAPPLVFTAPASAASPAPTATQPASRQASAPKTAPTPAPKSNGQYKDGSYTGPEIDAYYGLVKIKAVVQNGRIADVQFLEYPNDRNTSVRINRIAIPYLQREAISAQSANVNFISGATLTSEAFAESLQTALRSAKN